MKWNWQQTDWPHFTYDNKKVEVLEKQFLQNSGVLIGAYKHLDVNDQNQIKIDLISNEAIKTSEIEGEYLNRDSVQSSVKRHFGLSSAASTVPAAEKAIADMMLDLYDSYDSHLTHTTLHNWHSLLCANRNDIKAIGLYRTHSEPMQVISGPVHKPKVHFEAPPSQTMKPEMKRFIDWFNSSQHDTPPLTRAAIAHLHFICIHPFEDGNGRIGRAIAEKSLAQSLGQPTLIALAHTIEKHKKHYYAQLEKSNKTNEITAWIIYFAKTILEAQQHSLKQIELLIAKSKMFDRLNGELNPRQTKAILRMFKEGTEGFEGGLSAENYRTITKTSTATATRDLRDLIEKGAFIRTGELKHSRYWLNI